MEATNVASPVPASQAEKVSMRIGMRVEEGVWFSMGQDDRARYIESIMLSKHSRAEMRWARWKARPRLLRANAK